MKRPIVITTPHPTPEETAKLLGVSKKDVKFVKALVEKWVWSPETIREFGDPRQGHAARRKKPTGKRAPGESGHR